MRVARILIGFVYGSTVAWAIAVAAAPLWAWRDGDLGFAFLVAAVFAVWLMLTLGVAVIGCGLALWTFARGPHPGRRRDLAITIAGAVAVVALGGYTYYLFTQ